MNTGKDISSTTLLPKGSQTRLGMAATASEGTAHKLVTCKCGRTMLNSEDRGDSRKDGKMSRVVGASEQFNQPRGNKLRPVFAVTGVNLKERMKIKFKSLKTAAAAYKKEREKRGTQASVAVRLGVNRVTVARREAAMNVIPNEAWMALLALPKTNKK